MGFFDFFKRRKAKKADTIVKAPESRPTSFWGKIKSLFSSKPVLSEELIERIEEILLEADLGIVTTQKLVEMLQEEYTSGSTFDAIVEKLKAHIVALLTPPVPSQQVSKPTSPYVVLIVGINGVGKTTTIGKLAYHYSQQGKKVLIGAGDTFRAAAQSQSLLWGKQLDVPVVSQGTHKDPASVAYHTVEEAIAQRRDVVLIDTAGRLHNKSHLMQELSKIKRVIDKKLPGAPQEVLLVLDGSTGQNAWQQAMHFHESLDITGLIITKLDSVAKGGVIVGIVSALKLPIRYIGVGEKAEDLLPFDAHAFACRLFD